MEWYYVEAGQRIGPVAATQLDTLLASGKIAPTTLVWKEGMADWQPYSVAWPAATPTPPMPTSAPPGTAVCAECARSFNREEMMPYQNSFVCASCKPIFLQRLREGAAPASHGLWRKGKDLVMPVGAQLPARCLKCAQSHGIEFIRRKVHWHSQWVYLLILLNLLIYAVVAIIIRKKAVIQVPICPEHRKRRAQIMTASALMTLLSIGLWVLAAYVNDGGMWILIGIGLFLVGIILGISKGTLVRATKIDERFVFVRGFGPPFLASLPEWSGPS